jgi:PPP family 3-phenylpropionic acid transporter
MALYLSLGNGLPLLIGSFIGGFIVDYAGYRALYGFFTIFALLGAALYFIGKKVKIIQ